jgi:transcriptional regulator with XRE-family HTH domain
MVVKLLHPANTRVRDTILTKLTQPVVMRGVQASILQDLPYSSLVREQHLPCFGKHISTHRTFLLTRGLFVKSYITNMPRNNPTMTNYRTILSKNLRGRMRAAGLTETKLSGKAGVSQKTVNNALNETSAATIDTIAGIAGALGIEPWLLLVPTIDASGGEDRAVTALVNAYTAAPTSAKRMLAAVAEHSSEYITTKR